MSDFDFNDDFPDCVCGQCEILMWKSVDGRLRAYDLYTNGSVMWTHPGMLDVVFCAHPKDVDNPNTYSIPDRHNVGRSQYLDCEYIEPYEDLPDGDSLDGGWNWGILHSVIETLIYEGWVCSPIVDCAPAA